MLAELLIIAVIFLFSFAFYRWATLKNEYFKERGIKHLKPTFFVGNFVGQLYDKYTASEFNQLLYQSFPEEPIYGLFEFRSPAYVVRDPETIKQIGVKDFDHFEDHRQFTDVKTDKLWGNALFFLKGEKWRQMRATLSPAFTGSKMRQMFELVADCADDIVKHFLKRVENGEKINIEMKDFFSRYTNDVIATCAFGIKINSIAEPDNEFYRNGKILMDFTGFKVVVKMIIMFNFPTIARIFNINLSGGAVGKSFENTILDTMKIRKEKNIFRPDMINILMQVRDGTLKHQTEDSKKDEEGFATVEESDIGKVTINRTWNDDEIVAQCFLFFTAGFETSSTMLTFASYELTANPDIQQKLYEEIVDMDRQLGGKRVTYDALQKMKYLDQVICESLRKWPASAQNDRVCSKDYVLTINGEQKIKIDKDMPLLFPIIAIHHDPKYFPEPERFDPERFSEENKHKIIAGTYLPFGVGPRNCIGSRFALMKIKAILYNLLLNFSFEPNEKTQIPMKLKKSAFLLHPENGMHLELKPRKK